MKLAFPCALFFGLVFGALAQDASRSIPATPIQLEEARKAGTAEALADGRARRFILPYRSILSAIPETSQLWLREWIELMEKRGVRPPAAFCAQDFDKLTVAEVQCYLAREEAYGEAMQKEIRLHFGDDIFARLDAEAKALYEAKNAPKPSTPKPATSKPKKQRS